MDKATAARAALSIPNSAHVIFLCVQTKIWLPVFGIFNVRTDVNACDCRRGVYGHRKRVYTENWLWEKNSSPHGGIEPASAACRSDALPAELHPHPELCRVYYFWSTLGVFCVGLLQIHPNPFPNFSASMNLLSWMHRFQLSHRCDCHCIKMLCAIWNSSTPESFTVSVFRCLNFCRNHAVAEWFSRLELYYFWGIADAGIVVPHPSLRMQI